MTVRIKKFQPGGIEKGPNRCSEAESSAVAKIDQEGDFDTENVYQPNSSARPVSNILHRKS